MRLQNIIRKYPKLYLDEIGFNENSFELEIDLFMTDEYENRKEFENDCYKIVEELKENGYKTAYDMEYSDYIIQLYIII